MFEYNILDLSYPSNLCHIYSKFSQLPGFVLIESADQLRGRFDILTAFPYELVSEKNLSDLSNLFTYLDSLLPTVHSSCDLPFQGGAIGYFSYDLACQLAGIEMETHPDMEGMPLFHLGLYDWAIIVDHHLKKVSLFNANTRKETPEIAAAMEVLWMGAGKEAATNTEFKIQLPLCSFVPYDDYQKSFRFIKDALFQGRCYQANLTQGFSLEFDGNSYAIYQKVRAVNPVPYGAFIKLKNADILSFSPECFLTYTQGKLTTSPIKGTARNEENEASDDAVKLALVNSEKNRAENIMIVDLLRNDLGKIAKTGSVRVTGLCELQSYKGVHHLVSHIEAECREEIGMFEAFGACFPGGSITGAPKLESMKVIAESEAFARGLYCGSIGYFSNHGRFDTNIAIRTITAKGDKLFFAAGGGIVMDSECDKEYDECFIKINPILKGLLENGK